MKEKSDRLMFCQKIRNFAAQTCLHTFQNVINRSKKTSELRFANLWRKDLEKMYAQGFVSCWYDPPPNGIAVLFGKEFDYERVNYPTLRPEKYWPKLNIHLKSATLGYLFASPFGMIGGIPIIGDWGMTFYTGKSEKIRDHFKKCYKTLYEIIGKIETGMTFSKLYSLAIQIIEKNKLKNHIEGYTDRMGTDLGHTVPFIDRNPNEKEFMKISSGDSEKINSVISHARIFSNEIEKYIISENCAFTFEPRFITPGNDLPMFSLHTIIQFIEGKKIILENFSGIFNLLNMKWITG